jgi:polysaccharide biosynthesis protein PslH
VRILWVKANKLLPVTSGGDIRSFHIARCLASSHELVFVSYYDGAKDPDYESELKRQFPSSVAICTGQRRRSAVGRAVDYLRHVSKETPYAVSRFACPAVREFIKHSFDAGRVDVALCDFLDAAVNFPQELTIPSVLFQHNVESEIWRRHALTESNPLKRAMYKLEYRKMLAYEKHEVKAFQHVIAVSPHDAELMHAVAAGSHITVVPTGVDLERFRPNHQASGLAPLVVFVGAMDWEPNIDAVTYFCREVWPKIRLRVPAAKFRIVGRNPDKRVRGLGSESVEITGSVPSVIEHMQEAAVVVVPLRVGGGTRLKIYEAMALGKAVVSTTVGAEGLDVHPGQDIALADEPNSFSDAVVRFLSDLQLRRRYESCAADLAARYGWPSIAARVGEVLEQVRGRCALDQSLRECGSPKLSCNPEFLSGEKVADH